MVPGFPLGTGVIPCTTQKIGLSPACFFTVLAQSADFVIFIQLFCQFPQILPRGWPSIENPRYLNWFQHIEFNSVYFFWFRLEMPSLGKFGRKNENFWFTQKISIYANLNMQNLMVLFTFSFFGWKYRFWANLLQKNKIIILSWNLVPRLI